MEGDEIECFDPESAGLQVHGCSPAMILKLKRFYQDRTGDVDLERLEEFTRGLK